MAPDNVEDRQVRKIIPTLRPPDKPTPRPALPRMLENNQTAFKRPSSTSPRPPKARSQSPASSDDGSEYSNSESETSVDKLRDCSPRSRLSHRTRSPKITHRDTSPSKSDIRFSPQRLSPPKHNNYRKLSISSSPQKKSHFSGLCITCIIVIIGIVLYATTLHSNAQNVTSDNNKFNRAEIIQEALKNLGDDINEIRSKFDFQDVAMWTEIEASIAEVLKNPKKPAIILLFSNKEDPMLCLAKMIANASKKALGSEESLVLSKDDLGNDHGTVIHEFKERIEQRKVVIVDNLMDIHPQALKAFHNMCDRENPLVGEAIYILTMIADGYNNQPFIKFVEDQLTKKLRGNVDDEKLQPLITRITDGVIIHVEPEPGITRCPIRY